MSIVIRWSRNNIIRFKLFIVQVVYINTNLLLYIQIYTEVYRWTLHGLILNNGNQFK